MTFLLKFRNTEVFCSVVLLGVRQTLNQGKNISQQPGCV